MDKPPRSNPAHSQPPPSCATTAPGSRLHQQRQGGRRRLGVGGHPAALLLAYARDRSFGDRVCHLLPAADRPQAVVSGCPGCCRWLPRSCRPPAASDGPQRRALGQPRPYLVTSLWMPLGARLAIALRPCAGKEVTWSRSPPAEPASIVGGALEQLSGVSDREGATVTTGARYRLDLKRLASPRTH
jgi:hypothetical protein